MPSPIWFVVRRPQLSPSRPHREGDELDRRMIRNSALVAVTGVGICAFTMRAWVREIVEWNELNDKKQALLCIHEKLDDLEDSPDDKAKAKAVLRILQRLVDLGEGEAVISLIEDAEKMAEKAHGDATGAPN